MAPTIDVCLEVGSKRSFASALDWPGWCRAGRDEGSAMDALVASGPRYRRAVGRWATGLTAPKDASALEVVERVRGNATTDFGAPGVEANADARPLDVAELRRQTALLEASWRAFDRSAEAHAGAVLRKGPRGGGRELDAIVRHVMEADVAYLSRLGGPNLKLHEDDTAEQTADVRRQILEVASSRARSEPPPRMPRSGTVWSPRYAIRRSAWHALDHAWEIEDRAVPQTDGS